jgi:hypothetical protein
LDCSSRRPSYDYRPEAALGKWAEPPSVEYYHQHWNSLPIIYKKIDILLYYYCSQYSDTGRIYIKGYLYPILYPKISKKDIFYPFMEQDILRI